MSHILHLLPRVVSVHDGGKIRIFCRKCGKTTDPVERPSLPHETIRCDCGFALEKIPLIVEGPRSIDGLVRYRCECGIVTNWIAPPRDPGYWVIHGTKPGEDPSDGLPGVVNENNKPSQSAVSPCALGRLADAYTLAIGAMHKIDRDKIPELVPLIEEEILPRLQRAMDLARQEDRQI